MQSRLKLLPKSVAEILGYAINSKSLVLILPGCLSVRASCLLTIICELKLSWGKSLKRLIMMLCLQCLRKKSCSFAKFCLGMGHLKAASFLACLEVYDADSSGPQLLSCPPQVLVAFSL